MSPIRRVLISVSDKTGIVPFAKELEQLRIEIISTGGTYRTLKEAGVDVIEISEVTGFPEILDGRVKTLHPKVHGGLLAIRENESHLKQMEEQGIVPIDCVVVNLYPFQQTVEKAGVTEEEAIENIDIGGPAMIRAAAKNHRDVTIIVDPNDYTSVLQEIKEMGTTSLNTRKRLAVKAFHHTAYYDAVIAGYFRKQIHDLFPEQLTLPFVKKQELRYGENPHQQAAFYREPFVQQGTFASAKQLHGKELSYNNLNDAHAALDLVREFTRPTVVALKHTNPCGVGMGETIWEAFDKAYEADPISIFGGIIALNRTVDFETAKRMKSIFLEMILAPDFEEDALNLLKQKKNLRLLKVDLKQSEASHPLLVRSIGGGLLVQQADQKMVTMDECQIVTKRAPDKDEWEQLLFAFKVVKHVKSNAIVLAKENRTLGIGAGQMNRVGAAKIAIEQAGENSKGAVLASDAFFPMPDTVEAAAAAGITAIIQPGGSIRDQESIDEANKHGIAMVFTGVRHFKH